MPTSNAPENYTCPICLGVKGLEAQDTLMRQTDVVYKDDLVTGFINSFFVGRNTGHVIIVPNEHYESIYTLPVRVGHRIFDVAQKVSLAMKKAYACDGITTRQNNESLVTNTRFTSISTYFHGTRTMAITLLSLQRSVWPIQKSELSMRRD